MNFKEMILAGTLAVTCLIQHAQSYVPSQQDISAFFTTKTRVVLDDNPLSGFNAAIKTVMQQEWKVTEFEFISNKEFEDSRFDPQYSFIYMSRLAFENDKTDAAYRFLHLSLGGDYFRLNEMPDIASIPLAYYGVEEDRYAYKLGILVRFMQNHARLIREHPEIVTANVFKHYNDNIKDIRSKTLYLLKEELARDLNASLINNIYPYNFEIVTSDDIETAIREQDPDVVFLHKVGPEGTKINARCYKIIIGAADANFYYFDYHKISDKKPDGFLESDFKSLVK
jgi:hypothetical protein